MPSLPYYFIYNWGRVVEWFILFSRAFRAKLINSIFSADKLLCVTWTFLWHLLFSLWPEVCVNVLFTSNLCFIIFSIIVLIHKYSQLLNSFSAIVYIKFTKDIASCCTWAWYPLFGNQNICKYHLFFSNIYLLMLLFLTIIL